MPSAAVETQQPTEVQELRQRLEAALGSLDELYTAALQLRDAAVPNMTDAHARAALRAALRGARGSLAPWCRARGRRMVHASEVAMGDRLIWAPVIGLAPPIDVTAAGGRDCHGMVTVVGVDAGGDRLLHVHADSWCTVERTPEPETDTPRLEASLAHARAALAGTEAA